MTDPGESSGRPAAADAGTADGESPRRSILVDIIEDGGDWSALDNPEALLIAAAEAAAAFPETKLAGTSAAIALSSDAEVAVLNGSYRGKGKPTNVLSFPALANARAPKDGPCFLGDIILAAETVMAEAREMGIPPAHHVQHLVVHGLLHLAGFDHETDAEAEAMEGLETRILATLGIPDPYAEPLSAADGSL